MPRSHDFSCQTTLLEVLLDRNCGNQAEQKNPLFISFQGKIPIITVPSLHS